MGTHRQFEGGGDPPQKPIPLPPKGGRIGDSCDGTSKLALQFILTPSLTPSGPFDWEGKSLDQEILNRMVPGFTVTAYTFNVWEGRPVLANRMSPEDFREATENPPKGIDETPNKPRTTGTDKDEEWKKNPRTVPSDPVRKLQKREEYEVKKVKQMPDGPNKIKLEVEAQNKKEKLLEKKINKRFGPEYGTPKVSDVVKYVAEQCGFSDARVDEVDIVMPTFDCREYYAREVLDICSKISGGAYTILENTLHFFTPGSRPNPVPATTDPNKKNWGTTVRDDDVIPNGIRKGTLEVEKNSENLVNKVQEANSGEKAKRKEKLVGDGQKDELHCSYEPEETFVFTMHSDGEGESLPRFIRQDWGDREIVQHYLDAGVAYPSPDYEGAVEPSSIWGVYVNTKEKAIRLVYADTGQPFVMPDNSLNPDYFLEFEYYYRAPVFRILSADASVGRWGERETIIVSPERQYDELYRRLAEAELADWCEPVTQVRCEVFDDVYQVGDTVRFIAPEIGLDKEFTIFEITRDFDAEVRQHYPQKDYGQSVQIKAGNKLPRELRHILAFLNRNINNLNRAFNLSDLNSESGSSVPVQWERYYPEGIEVRETVTCELGVMPLDRKGGRIGHTRIQS